MSAKKSLQEIIARGRLDGLKGRPLIDYVKDYRKLEREAFEAWFPEPEWKMEPPVNPQNRTALKPIKKVLWRSQNGRQVVVQGPFPEMFRSDTRKTVYEAQRRRVAYMYVHPPTASAEAYAKVLLTDIIEEPDESNEWGEICP